MPNRQRSQDPGLRNGDNDQKSKFPYLASDLAPIVLTTCFSLVKRFEAPWVSDMGSESMGEQHIFRGCKVLAAYLCLQREPKSLHLWRNFGSPAPSPPRMPWRASTESREGVGVRHSGPHGVGQTANACVVEATATCKDAKMLLCADTRTKK